MPAAKRSLQDRIDVADAKSFRWKLLLNVTECGKLLEKHPHFAPSTLEIIKKAIRQQEDADDNGVSVLLPTPKKMKPESGCSKGQPAGDGAPSASSTGLAPAVPGNEGDDGVAADNDNGSKGDGASETATTTDSDDRKISNGFCALEGHSPAQLKGYLLHLEPSTFNECNLKNLQTRGQRQVSMKVLCMYVEWCTGLPPSWSPTGSLRVQSVLLDYMKQRYEARGCRARGLLLPNNFCKNGLYELEVTKKGIRIDHRFTKVSVKIPASDFKKVKDPGTLRISDNHSEVMSRLVEAAPDGVGVLLSGLFRDHNVGAALELDRRCSAPGAVVVEQPFTKEELATLRQAAGEEGSSCDEEGEEEDQQQTGGDADLVESARESMLASAAASLGSNGDGKAGSQGRVASKVKEEAPPPTKAARGSRAHAKAKSTAGKVGAHGGTFKGASTAKVKEGVPSASSGGLMKHFRRGNGKDVGERKKAPPKK